MTENPVPLQIDDRYVSQLDIAGFSQMLKDPSSCYKYYWLEAIVHLITEGKTEASFDEIIDEMIADAWYSVRQFHIHLSGLSADGSVLDGLERAVMKLSELSALPADASGVEIKNAVHAYEKQLKPMKEQLTHMVPYRALSGFFMQADEAPDWNSIKRLTSYIRRINADVESLPYVITEEKGLNRRAVFSPAWIAMIQDHAVNILGWIQYEKVRWLQNQNPEVPGLVYKLAPMDEKMRHLSSVRKLWNGIMDCHDVIDVFTGKRIERQHYDVDHFIPWSFVMNDELWNLMPMDSSLNAAKSNRLPEWDPFFTNFAENQYQMFQLVSEKTSIHRLFDHCYKDNLHSIWAERELYRNGNTREEFFNVLDKNMRPVYDAAGRQGYEIWKYSETGRK